MNKLEELVFVHYNLRLRVKNLMDRPGADDKYDPIDLNHIFNDMDVLEPWLQEVDEPLLDGQHNENWLDEENATNEDQIGDNNDGEDDDSHRSDDDDGDDDGADDDYGGNVAVRGGASYGDHADSMGWAEGNQNYYGTQDTDHGRRDPEPGIEARRRHLDRLADFSSQDYVDRRRSVSIDHRMRDMQLDGGQQRYPYAIPLPVTALPMPTDYYTEHPTDFTSSIFDIPIQLYGHYPQQRPAQQSSPNRQPNEDDQFDPYRHSMWR